MDERPPQFSAASADLTGVDLSNPLLVVKFEHNWSLQQAYLRASKLAQQSGAEAAARVYSSFATVCSCAANFGFPREPYRPAWSDQMRRSFIPDDLSKSDVQFLEAAIPQIHFPWLRARVIDFLFLKRTRRELWPEGVTQYLTAAKTCFPAAQEEGLSCFKRALYLGRTLGKTSESRQQAEDATLAFIRTEAETVEARAAVGLLWSIQTGQFGEPVELSELASKLAQIYADAQNFHHAREAWSIAAKWLRRIDLHDKAEVALRRAADLFEVEGDFHFSATRYGAAVEAFLRGVQALQQVLASDQDINRVRLKTRDCQRKEQAAARRDAYQTKGTGQFDSVGEGLQKLAAAAPAHVAGFSWPDALFRLSLGFDVVEPSRIRADVLKFAEMAPLQAMMQKEYTDEAGRVAYRQNRIFLTSGDEFESAMKDAMFEHARIYEWDFRVETMIEPWRKTIWQEHQPSIQDFGFLVSSNPIVPPAQAYSIICGLQAGMSGDWLIASHILATKFEPLLRTFLDRKGIDTSNVQGDLTQPNKLLGGLLDLAETHRVMPDGYIFEMRGILNQKTGYDFRNRIAHGFASDAECYTSAAGPNLWWLVLNLLAKASAFFPED